MPGRAHAPAASRVAAPEEPESIRLIRRAIDQGITFRDNRWDYNGGASEIRMGKALRDGCRQKVFLMSKSDGRSRQSAAAQIDRSLQRLQTDHVDLTQFHEIILVAGQELWLRHRTGVVARLDGRDGFGRSAPGCRDARFEVCFQLGFNSVRCLDIFPPNEQRHQDHLHQGRPLAHLSHHGRVC